MYGGGGIRNILVVFPSDPLCDNDLRACMDNSIIGKENAQKTFIIHLANDNISFLD